MIFSEGKQSVHKNKEIMAYSASQIGSFDFVYYTDSNAKCLIPTKQNTSSRDSDCEWVFICCSALY